MNDETNDDLGPEMSDEKFDAWLQSVARDYNRPADRVPHEAMWSEIERGVAVAAATTAPARTAPARRRASTWWQAAAAVLLVAGGIGIGRQWHATTDAPTVASTDSVDSPRDVGADRAEALVPALDREVASVGSVASPAREPGAGTALAPAAGRAATRGAAPQANESYDIAAVEHLSRAEALLTSFRIPRVSPESAPMNRWARDLLADTRLLLDSPAATDARRRQLLEDLEMVLAQIVQLPAESSADRGLVQRSIERGAVLSRLRSSIPAGFTRGT